MTNNNDNQLAIKKLNSNVVKAKFAEVLGSKANQFILSVQTAINSSALKDSTDFNSIYGASMTAATLDLPVNPNLGFAYILPYKGQAQFQIGYKGFIQLAQRSGLFKTINVSMVKEGELVSYDRLTGYLKFDWKDKRTHLPDIGCVAYFQLLNGFEKSLYMTIEEIEAHGFKYSQSYKNDKSKKSSLSLWSTNFEAMAQKTCIKLLLSKYAPLSTDIQKAIESDQAVIKMDENKNEVEMEYVDNSKTAEVETSREIVKNTNPIIEFIKNAKSMEVLTQVKDQISSDEEMDAYNNKAEELAMD